MRLRLLLLALALGTPFARADEPKPQIPAPTLVVSPTPARGLARPKMWEFVNKSEITGVVTVIGRRNGLLRDIAPFEGFYSDSASSPYEAVGVRNTELQPMTEDTLFRIASMTKPITAVGIMILVDEGKLAIDDPVEKFLPEFKGQMLVEKRDKDTVTLRKPSRPISLKDLLTHTSGLPGGPPPGMADLYVSRRHTLSEAVMAFSQRPLEFEPGSKWAYCNAGIDTLGRVIEVVSGTSYEAFLKKRVFDPLGMKDTTFYPTPQQMARVAMTYGKKGEMLIETPYTIIGSAAGAKYPIPAGGLYSTAPDLARFYRMMLNNGTLGWTRILSEASVRAMTTNQIGDLKGAFTPGMGFGLGWAVVREPQGVTATLSPGSYGHGGAFGTQAWLDPTKDLFVVLLIQRSGLPNADASAMRQALQDAAIAAIK